LDGQQVDIVALVLFSKAVPDEHLATCANIAQLLHRADFRERLRRGFL